MKQLLIISSTLLLFIGCASNAKFVEKYNRWRGANIAHLTAQMGYPDNTFTLPNGNRVYIYEESRLYTYPSPMLGFSFGRYSYGRYDYGMYSYGNDVVQEKCKLYVETDKKGIIVNWSSKGNHCVSE